MPYDFHDYYLDKIIDISLGSLCLILGLSSAYCKYISNAFLNFQFSDNDMNEDRIKEEEDESLYWCIDGSLENSTIE